MTDRFAPARAVADAVLHEGYVLYPYRASAGKNRLRWTFGVLLPPSCVDPGTSDRSMVRTECIVDPGVAPVLHVRVRCLHVQRRTLEAITGAGAEPVSELVVDGERHLGWDEAVEVEVDLPPLGLLPLAGAYQDVPLHLEAATEVEELRDANGAVAGRVLRHREPVDAVATVCTSAADSSAGLLRVTVQVDNVTELDAIPPDRDGAVRRSLVAVHTLLAADDAVLVSAVDPPDVAVPAVAGCRSEGTHPVLVGDGGRLVLSSPIILDDQPEVAPESVGDLFDATEIDELLALRVLTLTAEEKAEARATDARAAVIIDRCDAMAPELWSRLHGAVRSLEPVVEPAPPEQTPWWDPDAEAAIDPWSEVLEVAGVLLGAGSKVVLRPGIRRADAHDLFLAGMTATVAGVFRDAEGASHLAVTVDDDPATEALHWQGRYLFFHPDEVEPIGAER